MDDGTVIREAAADDRDTVVNLWEKAGLVVPHNDPHQDFDRFLTSGHGGVLVADDGSDVVGSVAYGDDAHRGWMYYLAVDPNSRQQGIGKKLVDAVEVLFRERGVPKMQLMVRSTNETAGDFYRQIGYQEMPVSGFGKRLDGAVVEPPKLDVVITHLEMRSRPNLASVTPAEPAVLTQVPRPSVRFYRYLYDSVGAAGLWWERRAMSDEELAETIRSEDTEVHILLVGSEPAGFVELNSGEFPIVNLAYFGLIPEFIGRGLGSYLIGEAIRLAWDKSPELLTVNTNSLDHPRALRMYQQKGFVPVREERVSWVDPRFTRLIENGGTLWA
ncbi:MAG: GNAT family acetyltransferase [Acidimicrobiia bacterium]|nr:GNAT family acetyltransferase [Acidimicrobiia bacterium]